MGRLRVGKNFTIDTPDEIPSVTNALRRALGAKDLRLSTQAVGPQAIQTVISTGAMIDDTDGGSIVPFATFGEWRYFLSAAFDFNIKAGVASFKSASMTIWRSALVTAAPMRILRAEWEVRRDAHAQPHWHVYLAEVEKSASQGATRSRSIERFHLAMAAEWCTGSASHYRDPTASNVASWVYYCLVYSRSQLESISRRS